MVAASGNSLSRIGIINSNNQSFKRFDYEVFFHIYRNVTTMSSYFRPMFLFIPSENRRFYSGTGKGHWPETSETI